MTVNFNQLYDAPALYVTGIPLTITGNSTFTLGTGQWRDSTNRFDAYFNSTVSVDCTTVGLNGLDTGSLAASKWYYVYGIADERGYSTTGSIVSLSPVASGVLMPAGVNNTVGYQLSRLLYIINTNSSSQFITQTVFSSGASKVHVYDAAIKTIDAKGSTAGASASLDAAVPPIAAILYKANTFFTPNTAGNTFQLYPTGSTSAQPVTGSSVAKLAQDSQFDLQANVKSGVASTDYKTSESSDSLTMFVNRYQYSI